MATVLAAALIALVFAVGCGELGPGSNDNEGSNLLDRDNPVIQSVMNVQSRHSAALMEDSEIVGTATGLDADGHPAIIVLTRSTAAGGLPATIEGVPVVVVVSGPFSALHHRPGHDGGPSGGGGGPGGGEETVDPTLRFARPVPIGISTGNAGQCLAGTIAARVTDGTDVYALSNNHVYALQNSAPIGSAVMQPGLFDTGCAFDSNNSLGQLNDFEPLVFSTAASNTIDAAIALTSAADLGQATPSDGYGMPKSATVSEALGMAVKKYGRTTSLTSGTITGINLIVNVGYNSGTARFVGQILVESRKPLIKAGDSGSLLVTDPGRNPVGLMFAGNQSGKLGVANQIGLVLIRFGVSIDGE